MTSASIPASSSNTSAITVAQSLSQMAFTKDLKQFIVANRDNWANFGKKSSHTLRNHLMGLFKKDKLSPEAIFMVYYFHSVVKDVGRILAAMETLPSDIQSREWFKEVTKFLQTRMTKYVSNETSDKFASVHLPSTNPGLDVLCAAYTEARPTTKEEMEAALVRIIGRNTFAQLAIDPALQAENKIHVQVFWNTVVSKEKVRETRRKRAAKVEEEGFQEAYYNTSAADNYYLVDLNLKEWKPKNGPVYTKEDIIMWFFYVHDFTEDDAEALLDGKTVKKPEEKEEEKDNGNNTAEGSSSRTRDDRKKAEMEALEALTVALETDKVGLLEMENKLGEMKKEMRGMATTTDSEKRARDILKAEVETLELKVKQKEKDLEEQEKHFDARKASFEREFREG